MGSSPVLQIFLRGATYLSIALVCIAVTFLGAYRETPHPARWLASSAALYSITFGFIWPTNPLRYFAWPITATLLSAFLLVSMRSDTNAAKSS